MTELFVVKTNERLVIKHPKIIRLSEEGFEFPLKVQKP
nr:Uncharacterised protein [Raoultella sp. NCTC 9187]